MSDTLTALATEVSTPTRRDLAAHIESAFADVEVGTFLTVAEIARHQSAEYGETRPSAGAITARLFPASGTCTVPGVRPGRGGESGAKGATKVVEFVIDGVRWQTGPVG